MKAGFNDKKVREVAGVLKMMSNPNRLAILCNLSERECSVGELTELVGLSQSALSQHLAKLREDELVETRREAQTIYYRVASKEVLSLLKTLQRLYC